MLQSTFCHIPGVGAKTEQRLWHAGVVSWQAATGPAAVPLPGAWPEVVARHAQESQERLTAADARYFADRLPSCEHWRLFPEFRDRIAYVDIETTGLGGPGDYITTIALYDGRSVRHYVHGQNLEAFRDDIRGFRVLVTYNGKTFDLPFIRHHLGLSMSQAHIDLRYVLHSLGYRGGLKGCERQLGLDRGDLAELDGYFAVLLWRDFLDSGAPAALETLLAYNVQDVLNLETLLVTAYNMKLAQTPFAARLALPPPSPAANPFAPDQGTIERIKTAHPRYWGRAAFAW